MGWFKTNKKLRNEVNRLENQIRLMQDHFSVQNKEILSLKRKVRELEMLLDIEQNTKRY
jgi:predicted RNase H-like nuclease (RuvC/YqgF family)